MSTHERPYPHLPHSMDLPHDLAAAERPADEVPASLNIPELEFDEVESIAPMPVHDLGPNAHRSTMSSPYLRSSPYLNGRPLELPRFETPLDDMPLPSVEHAPAPPLEAPNPRPGKAWHEKRFFICVDYGTTYTGVAWILTDGQVPTRENIKVVDKWGNNNQVKVPSLYTYSASNGERWGFDIGDDAFVIRWSKLELGRRTPLDALSMLERTIDKAGHLDLGPHGMFPGHLMRGTTDVITDYLRKVALCVRSHIENNAGGEVALKEFPIDLIVTHPAEWDYKACNSTFRCVNDAFQGVFPELLAPQNHIRMGTEPEACAQFTMKYSRDREENALRVGECVIVVDAGGGTVDLVSYLVMSLNPFTLKKVTDVCGARCGASRIDDAFLGEFLESRLSKKDLQTLRSGSSKNENHSKGEHYVVSRRVQILLKNFQDIKHSFAGLPPDDHEDPGRWLDLPRGIGDKSKVSKGVKDGQLLITCKDLEWMFEKSVDKTLQLIINQMEQVQAAMLEVKTIYLSGGFSQSPYLTKRVKELADRYSIYVSGGYERQTGLETTRSKNNSWSAVAQGGVLLGLGLDCTQPPLAKPCPVHIGVILAETWTGTFHSSTQRYTDSFDNEERAKNNIKWLVTQGDLITEKTPIEITQKIVRKISAGASRKGVIQIVFSKYNVKTAEKNLLLDSRPPTNMDQIDSHARRTVDLRYELALATLGEKTGPNSSESYLEAEMQLRIHINHERANFQLRAGGGSGRRGSNLPPMTDDSKTLEELSTAWS